MSTGKDQEGAEVISLHADEQDSTVVHEAEIVDDRAERPAPVSKRVRHAFDTRRLPRISDERRQKMADGAVRLHHRATPVVRAGSRTTAKATVRHAVHIGAGVGVVRRRRRDARTADPYVRAMRTAEQSGDTEAVERWADRIETAKKSRHQRRMDWLRSPKELAKAGLLSAVAGLVVLLGLGVVLAVADGDAGMVLEPISAVITTIRWMWWIVTAYGLLLLTGGIAIGLAYLWDQGRKHGAMPGPQWAQSTADGMAEHTDLVDEASILGALRHLGVKALNDAFKQGWGSQTSPVRVWEMGLGQDGKGARCQIRLPKACPVSEVNRKKEILAHNLGRQPVEVWISEPRNQPGVMDLWIADPGVLTGPVPDWPLLANLDTASTDYFAGVPVAQNLRGDAVTGDFAGKNWAVAGMMGSGKSSLVITALLGAILDPLVEADVFVCAQNADYEIMRPRLRQLVTGPGDDTVEAAMHTLHELYEELDTRGRVLAEHTQAGDTEADKVTRRLAEKDARLRPRIMVVDECQALFMHEDHGAEAERLAILLMNASRKYGITLIFLTPEPSSDSLPRKLMAVMSNKACFAIGDQQSNDALLGTSSYKRGISAVGLEPASSEGPGDVGTAMTSLGFLAKPGLMRCHHVPRDRHQAIVDRALALQADQEPAPALEPAHRDLLDDVAAVLASTETSPAADVASALRTAHPRHRPYQSLTKQSLVQALRDEGVTVPSTGNRYPIDPDAVAAAQATRHQPDDDTEPEH